MADTLEEVQDGILERLHAGEAPDREALLARHPDLAAELGPFLDLVAEFEASGGPPAPTRLGEFRIHRELGRGGMGVVYEAEQTSLRRRVALKVLPPALRSDATLVARFRREAEAAGRLRHPGIVPVFAVGEEAGTPFFAMELVEGRSLDAVVTAWRAGDFAEDVRDPDARRRRVLDWGVKVAEALAYAHGRGILHRDVKPGNILLDGNGAPRLTDFGLALDLLSPGLTAAGEVFGSPQYMSPEQAVRRETPLDARTDVYSLAVTLYELFTLRLPYEGTTTPELLSALAAGRMVPPGKADPAMPTALADVLERALRRSPEERYASAAEFGDDLRAILVGKVPVTPACTAPRRRRRRMVLAAAAVVGVALGLGILHGIRSRVVPPAGVAPEELLRGREAEVLARGDVPEGDAALLRVVRCSVAARGILSRSEPGVFEYTAALTTVDDGGPSRTVVVDIDWDISVNGAPWTEVGSSPLLVGASERPGFLGSPVVATASTGCSPDTGSILAAAGDATTVRVRHRARLRCGFASGGGTDGGGSAGTGTTATWTSPERTYLVCDRFPADYPATVAGEDVDRAMTAALTPDGFRYQGMSEENGKPMLELVLIHRRSRGPLAAAGEMDLVDPRDGTVLGTTDVVFEAAPPRTWGEESQYFVGLRFLLAPGDDDGQAGRLLELEAGRCPSLRIVMRPSRRVALGDPSLDRYWGGTLNVEVPVEAE